MFCSVDFVDSGLLHGAGHYQRKSMCSLKDLQEMGALSGLEKIEASYFNVLVAVF